MTATSERDKAESALVQQARQHQVEKHVFETSQCSQNQLMPTTRATVCINLTCNHTGRRAVATSLMRGAVAREAAPNQPLFITFVFHLQAEEQRLRHRCEEQLTEKQRQYRAQAEAQERDLIELKLKLERYEDHGARVSFVPSFVRLCSGCFGFTCNVIDSNAGQGQGELSEADRLTVALWLLTLFAM